MILEALKAGKNVVSANKDLIAEEGKEIFDTAQAAGKDFLFEAAVAGGIPIIRPLKQCLAGNDLTDILGIEQLLLCPACVPIGTLAFLQAIRLEPYIRNLCQTAFLVILTIWQPHPHCHTQPVPLRIFPRH